MTVLRKPIRLGENINDYNILCILYYVNSGCTLVKENPAHLCSHFA